MDYYKNYFYMEMDKQISFGSISLEKILNDTKMIMDENNETIIDNNKFWYSVQGLLVSLANISKILYPVRKQYRQRGDYLRKELKIPRDTVFNNRDLRNCFEHYDEHIDEFFKTISKPGSIFVDSNMVEIKIENVNMPVVFMRNYLPKTKILSFKNISLSLDVVQSDLEILKQKVSNILIKSK